MENERQSAEVLTENNVYIHKAQDEIDVTFKSKRNQVKPLVFKVYKRRWFILFVLCVLNCSNSMLWLSFAPVADQSGQYLQANLDQINWLSLVYMVVAIPLSLGATWMLDTLGLRSTLILGSWLNMLGAGLRFVGVQRSLDASVYYPVVMTGQTLCALAQTLIIFSPTKLAALWFPEHQRATANMIASMSNPLGLLFANILSPLVVGRNNNLPLLMLVYTIPAVLACLLATVGIRSSIPPTAPSASAETSNSEPFFQGIKQLMRNKAYMILLVCFGSGVAAFTCFSTLLEQILCVRGYTNDFSGWCGALFILFGVVGAALLGVYVDKTKKFIEATKINMSFTALACIAFAVVSQMREQEVAVAAVCSLFGFFGFSIYPIAMELSVECSYPVGEATSAGLVFISGQVQSVIYMVVLQGLTVQLADSPYSTCSTGGDAALSWRVSVLVMAGLWTLFSSVFILFFNTRYRRLEAENQGPPGKRLEDDNQGPPEKRLEAENQGPLEKRLEAENQGPLEKRLEAENQGPLEKRLESENQRPLEKRMEAENQGPLEKRLEAENQGPLEKRLEAENQGPSENRLEAENQGPLEKRLEAENQGPLEKRLEAENQGPLEKRLESENQGPLEKRLEAENQGPSENRLEAENQGPSENRLEAENQGPLEKRLEAENQGPSENRLEAENQGPPEKRPEVENQVKRLESEAATVLQEQNHGDSSVSNMLDNPAV